jgi:hypothetical protein
MINGMSKTYYGFENNGNSTDLWLQVKKKLLFDVVITHVVLYGCEVWGYNTSRESWRKIEKIQKYFITHNIKIKSNTPILSSS